MEYLLIFFGILVAAFLLSPAIILWAYNKKGKIILSIACALSLVLFFVEGMKLYCLLVWLLCLLFAIVMKRKY